MLDSLAGFARTVHGVAHVKSCAKSESYFRTMKIEPQSYPLGSENAGNIISRTRSYVELTTYPFKELL